MGRHEMFEEPWRNDEVGQRKDEVTPSVVRPQQIEAEIKVAVQYLAHFYQALSERYPLIIAAPVSDFHTGSSLHALISVARAALPANLKYRCKVRVYTRLPEVFLVQQKADLVVVPEAVAGDALAAAQRQPVLLDRQGQVVTGRSSLDHGALGYARRVLSRVRKLPEGLLLFSQRYQNQLDDGLPSSEGVEAVPLTYNLAYAMSASASAERRQGLIDYLLKQAEERDPSEVSDDRLRWQRLIRSDEWDLFPPADLCRVLFQDPEELKPGGKEFQHEVEDAAGRLTLDTGSYLQQWWDAGDERKQRRLQQLLAHRPPLVSERTVVDYLSDVPIDRLAAKGPVHGLLEAERKAGIIGNRSRESVELAKLASDDQVRAVLSRATSEGALSPTWAPRYVGLADEAQLLVMAQELLAIPESWEPWSNAPKVLFDAIREFQSIPRKLRRGVLAAGEMLSPTEALEVYLRLADIVARIDAVETPPPDNPLIARLMVALTEITEFADRKYLIRLALADDWPCLTPRILVSRLPHAWWDELAAFLINESAIREIIETPFLLQLGRKLAAEEVKALEKLFETLNERMMSEPDGTIRALISRGWWWSWRQQSPLTADQYRVTGLKWLSCDAWLSGDAPEATLEAWNQVMGDLKPGGLSGEEMKRLCSGGLGVRRMLWPAIPPFENQQLDDLCELATDLGALLELAESVDENELSFPLGDPIARYLLVLSDLRGELPEDSLHWLKSTGTVWPIEPPDLTIEQADELCRKAGHLQDRADEAREQAVARAVFEDLGGALDAADRLSLWHTQSFLAKLTDRLFSLSSVADLRDENAIRINSRVDSALSLNQSHVSDIPAQFVADGRFSNIAEFLRPGIGQQIQTRSLPGRVLDALAEAKPNDPCWKKAAQPPKGNDIPLLSLIAFKIRHQDVNADKWHGIHKNGWRTFMHAIERCDWLLEPVKDPRAGLPALYLAASLLGDGKMGSAAGRLIRMGRSARYRRDYKWWRALLRALWTSPTGYVFWSADDRPDIALSLISGAVSYLPEAEQKSFNVALRDLRRSERPGSLLEELHPRHPDWAA